MEHKSNLVQTMQRVGTSHIWRGSVRFFRTEQKKRERQLEVSSKFIISFDVIIWRRYLIAPTACCKHQQALYHPT